MVEVSIHSATLCSLSAERPLALTNVDELVLLARDVGDVHVVRRGRDVLVLALREDVGSDEVHLGVTVLARLGGRHVDDLRAARESVGVGQRTAPWLSSWRCMRRSLSLSMLTLQGRPLMTT